MLERLFVTARFATQHGGLVARVRGAGAEVLVVSEALLAGLTDTVTPQGAVGVATLPRAELRLALEGATLVVALHQARDPGNVGTAVRTADAAGADAVVLTEGSAHPRSPKAVRASTGSLFHLPVVADVTPDQLLGACAAGGLQVLAASPRAALAHTQVDLTRPTALLFGNEARGLPGELVARCDLAAGVPLYGRAESLNLAATVAVFLYEAARQRRAG